MLCGGGLLVISKRKTHTEEPRTGRYLNFTKLDELLGVRNVARIHI